MGTKNDPGPNDCYAKALPDEPIFTLLARSPEAPGLVREWAKRYSARKARNWHMMMSNEREAINARVKNAHDIADAMERWHRENPDV